MPAVTKDEAVAMLSRAVEQFGWDEVLEVYNELFPDEKHTEEETRADATPLVRRLVSYFNSGLLPEQVADLFGMIFPRHRRIRYDEEEERIHYQEAKRAPVE
jgi:hypothetical protein